MRKEKTMVFVLLIAAIFIVPPILGIAFEKAGEELPEENKTEERTVKVTYDYTHGKAI